MNEEIYYGIHDLGLPVIIIYPEYKDDKLIHNTIDIKPEIKRLWDNLPVFRDNFKNVPTLHIPLDKGLIRKALSNPGFTIQNKIDSEAYFFKSTAVNIGLLYK